jgi:hypothetical protein
MPDLLERWGPIADFLKVSERTAINYFKFRGLPITFDPAGHPMILKNDVIQWKLSNTRTIVLK